MNYITLLLIFSLITVMLMKLVAYLFAKGQNLYISRSFFYTTPTLCPKSHAKLAGKPLKNKEIYFDLLFSTFCMIIFLSYFHILDNEFTFFSSYQAYYAIFIVYFFTLFIGASFQTFALLFGNHTHPIHNKVFLSKSLNEFWTLRWNVWVRNWLHYIIKNIFKTNTKLRPFMVFLLSGFFHECMVNLPYYFYSGEILFGSMMSYFIIQYFALLFDKYLLTKTNTHIRYLFMWLAILLPAPLFMNKALLLFFGFY